MPIYEFKCSDCGEYLEFILKEPTLHPACRKCKSDNIILVPSRAGFVVNGYSYNNGYSAGCEMVSYDD